MNQYEPILTPMDEQLAQQYKEDRHAILRQAALDLAIQSHIGTSSKHVVDIAEDFYKFLSAEK